MKGMFFVHMQKVGPEAFNLRTGVVQRELGNTGSFLLAFTGANYRFSNVFSPAQLEHFVLFDTEADRAQFLAELQESKQPPQSNTDTVPGVTIEPPAAGSAPSTEDVPVEA